jgi:hypothetical protein
MPTQSAPAPVIVIGTIHDRIRSRGGYSQVASATSNMAFGINFQVRW